MTALVFFVLSLTVLCAALAVAARVWASGDVGRRTVRRLGNVAGSLALVLVLALAAVPVYGHVSGDYRILPILSGSMEPEMATGDAAWVVQKPLDELAEGDVLVFDPPETEPGEQTTIHRVVELVPEDEVAPVDRQEGAVYIRTKGDANEDADPWVAAIDSEQVWVHERTVPEVGALLTTTRGTNVRLMGLLLLAGLFALWGVGTLVQGARETPTLVAAAERAKARRTEVATGRRKASRPAVAMGVVGAVLAGLVLASSASYFDAEPVDGTLPTGVVALETGSSTLNVPVSGLLPGDSAQALLTLSHTGDIALRGAGPSDEVGLQLQVTGGSPSSELVEDPSGGLQLVIERCDQAWVVGPDVDGRPTYTCPDVGGPVVVADSRPVLGRVDLLEPPFEAYTPAGTDHLRLTLSLPDTAPPTMAGESTEVGFNILALQRDGENR